MNPRSKRAGSPETVETPWIKSIASGHDRSEGTLKARQPHGRLVKPEDIGSTAAYLASDESESVIGACMVMNEEMMAR